MVGGGGGEGVSTGQTTRVVQSLLELRDPPEAGGTDGIAQRVQVIDQLTPNGQGPGRATLSLGPAPLRGGKES